ncbi:MAG TPA: chemotaxis protein CheB [Rhodanobacteraceae bacterium]|nr:chemotaxis protein CheB [Rhodanobacteraceae bacterium]
MPKPEAKAAVALLYQSHALGIHVHEALADCGIGIAYEASTESFDSAALRDSGAHVVVVNLDADVEAHLDSVHPLLDDASYNVIFNDAQVSKQLSGWEHARWLRHLAAKILGTSDADPPRPFVEAGQSDGLEQPVATATQETVALAAAPAVVERSIEAAEPDVVAAETNGSGTIESAERPPVPVLTDPAEFNIDKISSEEFLAPIAPPPVPSKPEEDIVLELVPMEEAIAVEVAPRQHETRLEPAAVPQSRISRVWVLGASIGGPEAVGAFLALLPRDYPALFMLVQKLDDALVDLMVQQLTHVTALTVRKPGQNDIVAHGEVLIVPEAGRLLVDPQGRVDLVPDADASTDGSAIDRLIGDVADRFGARAGAILFSGTIADIGEGGRRLIEKGGLIHAQDAESCVGGSMPEEALAEDIVDFYGSPYELAEKLLTAVGD